MEALRPYCRGRSSNTARRQRRSLANISSLPTEFDLIVPACRPESLTGNRWLLDCYFLTAESLPSSSLYLVNHQFTWQRFDKLGQEKKVRRRSDPQRPGSIGWSARSFCVKLLDEIEAALSFSVFCVTIFKSDLLFCDLPPPFSWSCRNEKCNPHCR